MPPKKVNRAKEQGLERTDNDLDFASWPQVPMINQKNYYTEYLKRDDQILVLRMQTEENRNKLTKAARERDRVHNGISGLDGLDVDLEASLVTDENTENVPTSEAFGAKIIVIHPGSQNLRVGLASDALPKTVPMAIARRCRRSESEEENAEPLPKRRKVEGETEAETQDIPNDELKKFEDEYLAMTADLKARLRKKGRRIVPNSREQAVAFNRKSQPEIISEHNDSHRVEWTDLSSMQGVAPEYFTGQAALRVPDFSRPRYKLFWPIRQGMFNERDYSNKNQLIRDFSVIIEDAIKHQLGLSRRNEWTQYDCVFVIPDLYERSYVTTVLDILLRDFRFSRVSFIQESLSASFGAGYSTCVVVDVGAQKTSVCCVDEGMCVESSRINLKIGGSDVTDTFVRMMLVNRFPYADLNLRRRYDFLLAEELKQRLCTFLHADVAVQTSEFHLRAFGQDTRHYLFKTYDEVMLAPMGMYSPKIFDGTIKLVGRRTLLERSYDLYDGSPNDPVSAAHINVLESSVRELQQPMNGGITVHTDKGVVRSTPYNQEQPSTPRASTVLDDANGIMVASSPGQDERDATLLAKATTPPGAEREVPNAAHPLLDLIRIAEARDRTLPSMPLDKAIILAIENGARGDEKKMRDYFGGIIPIGGGSLINGFNQFLEEELVDSQPQFKKEVIVAPPPRDIDPQVLVWKGASVFGKLQSTNDSWIGGMEYDRLGNRLLAYKCLWSW